MKLIKQIMSLGMMGLLFFGTIPSTWAQTKLDINGVVIDQNKAIVAGAEVTVTLVEDESVSQVTKTDNQGRFHFSGMPAGTYTVTVFAATFDLSKTPLKLDKAQSSPYVVTLKFTVNTVIDVNENADTLATTDPALNGNAIILGPQDLEGLPDDPDDLLAALKDMAGPASGVDDASVYVDGFLERGRIPPKEAILRVMINANPYSPEFSEPGFSRIQIITKPGTDIFHASAGFRFNNQGMDARNPFVAVKAPYELRNYSGTLSGPIIKGKAAFFFDAERNEVNDNSYINALTFDPTSPTLSTPFTATVLSPQRLLTLNIRSDFAVSKKDTLMVGFRWLDRSSDNTGAGGFTLADHVANSSSTDYQMRVSDTYIVNQSMLNEFRFQLDRQFSSAQALSAAQQITVTQGFTSGGDQGQLFNQSETKSLDLNDNFSLVHGAHTTKYGVGIILNNVDGLNRGNFGGSYVFPNFQTYADAIDGVPGARAQSFSIVSGIPSANSTLWRFGFYGMDDWKIRPNFTFSYGLRWETQTHLPDHINPSPRVSFAWSPDSKGGANGKTSIRGGIGMFYNQLAEGALLAVQRADGLHQINTTIPCPVFGNPNPGDVNTCPSDILPFVTTLSNVSLPTIRQFEPGLRMPYTIQWNIGVDRTLPKGFFVSTTYTRIKGVHLFRSIDVNAPDPVTGVIPDPSVGPIYQVQSDGNFIRNMMSINLRRQISKWVSVNINYILGKSESDYGGGGFGGGGISGIFSLPTNQFNPELDFGRVDGDSRHQVIMTAQVNLPHGFRLSPFIRYSSSAPFNITTGLDNNGDGIFNDRPSLASTAEIAAFQAALASSNNLQLAEQKTGIFATQWGFLNIHPLAGEEIIPRNFGTNPAHFAMDLTATKTIGWGEARRGGWQAPPDASGGDQTNGQRGGRPGGGRPGGGGGGGPRGGGGGGGGRGGGGGGRGGGGGFGGGNETSKRYNLTFTLAARNIFNMTQLGGFSGSLTNPRFGTITSASAPRNVTASLRFNW